jgi:hypothetical protein
VWQVLGPVDKVQPDQATVEERVRELLKMELEEGTPMSEAVKKVGKAVGKDVVTRAQVYDIALALKGIKGGQQQ